MEHKENCCGMGMKKMGFIMIILGGLILVNAYFLFVGWGVFIGGILVIAGIIKIAKGCCGKKKHRR